MSAHLPGITRKQIIRYVALPGIAPRFAQLFASGFSYISFFIALVYQAVNLLPDSHPYTNPANIGRFGIRHVIGEAANHLVLSPRHLDQLVLFVCILIGLAIVLVQVCLVVGALAFQPVMAFPVTFDQFFITPPATQDTDLAHMLLDLVFGVPDIFDSCVSTAAVCQDLNGNPIPALFDPGNNPLFGGLGMIGPLSPTGFAFFPFAFHEGLHQMFQFYSLGLMIVAVIISSYFIITVIAETAETGTAFGKRFNKVWAPLRFAIAFGLLMPIGFGLNSAQYIVLYAAKFGSGFATNGWNLFNAELVDSSNVAYLNNAVGNAVRLVTRPSTPETAIGELIKLFFIARTCKYAEELIYNKDDLPAAQHIDIIPYLVRGVTFTPATDNALPVDWGTTYEDMMAFAAGSDTVTMRFGIRRSPPGTPALPGYPSDAVGPNESHYGWYKGYVKPICGEVKMNLTDSRLPANNNMGTEAIQRYFWFILVELWYSDVLVWDFGAENYPENYAIIYTQWETPPPPPGPQEPDSAYKNWVRRAYTRDFVCMMTAICTGPLPFPATVPNPAMAIQAASNSWTVPAALRAKGWAGAGIWYNRVAELNGALTTAAYNIPTVSRYPYVMEYVKEKKRQYDQSTTYGDIFMPLLADGQDVPMQRPEDESISRVLNKAYAYWTSDGGLSSTHTETTGNIILDTINFLLGTDGLYSMRKNPDIHPLAQLVGVGRALVESSIRNLVFAGTAKLFEQASTSQTGIVFASFFITVATIGLTAGFVLFYVVPFLPFIYFFFAVGGWIKGIFEAMVGAPLWALAHIRIDGNGLPGQAAVNGYFLVFEIFIRPLLIIFGLIASISIFAALVDVLNTIFDLVTSNLSGFDVDCELNIATCENGTPSVTDIEFYRGPIDEFFFTVLYALLVYLIGLSSFKLIDLIPNNILRWMGSSVPTFNDQREDPTQGMIGTSTIGAQQAIGQLGGGLQGMLKIGS